MAIPALLCRVGQPVRTVGARLEAYMTVVTQNVPFPNTCAATSSVGLLVVRYVVRLYSVLLQRRLIVY